MSSEARSNAVVTTGDGDTTVVAEPDSLTEKINEGHRRVEDAARRTVQIATESVLAAIETGKLLIEKKAQVDHGKWSAWKDDEFEGSSRKAELYMQFAKRSEDSQRIAHLGIAEVQKQLNAATPQKRKTKNQKINTKKIKTEEPAPPAQSVMPDDALGELCSGLVRTAVPLMASQVVERAIELAEPDDRGRVASQDAAMLREAQAYLNRISAEPTDLAAWDYAELIAESDG
jgi:Protein of unknown function (DUF3102)